jgi:hypothetical protein
MILLNPAKIPRLSTSLCDILWYVFQGYHEIRVWLNHQGRLQGGRAHGPVVSARKKPETFAETGHSHKACTVVPRVVHIEAVFDVGIQYARMTCECWHN